jgi:hypothetical protein
MKKKLLTLAVLMSIGSSAAFAADVKDVPANHWAYPAVKALIKDGIVDGFNDGTFKGDKEITRYEMAQIVEKAMNNANKANVKQKALIDKLAAEFALEINKIDTRVNTVEKFTKSSLKVGFDSLMYWTNDNPPAGQQQVKGNDQFGTRVRLYLSGDVNEKTKFNIRLASAIGTPGAGTATGSNIWVETGYFTFSDVLGFKTVKLGRQGLLELGGNVLKKEANDGITLEKALSNNTTARVGVLVTKQDAANSYNSQDIQFVSLNTKFNDKAGASIVGVNNHINQPTVAASRVSYGGSQIGGISAYQRIGKWTLLGEYDRASLNDAVSANAPTENPHAYGIQLSTSKKPLFFLAPQFMVDHTKVGDSAFTVAYHYLGAGATPVGLGPWSSATNRSPLYTTGDFKDNVKGWGVDYQYTFLKNMVVDLTYQKLTIANTVGALTSGKKLDAFYGVTLQTKF